MLHLASLISQEQFERVKAYVERGVTEGGQLVTGGNRLTDGYPAGGYYYEPTIFADVTPQMTIAREEIFGPVLSVLTFEDEDEAVELANEVIYGLTAAVWTRDIARANRMVRRIKSGTVWTNMINKMHVAVPAGGHGQSGLGNEYGIEGAENYTRLKTVWVNIGEAPVGWDV